MSATSPQEALSGKNEKSRTHARVRGGAIAQPRARGVVTQSLLKVLEKAKALDADVGIHLALFPSARIAHHRNALLDALQRELAAVQEAEVREAERAARREANARDRALRSWEPHQIRAAEKMGFEDPADWRAYVDEREAFRDTGPYVEGLEFPTPEEWRQRR